MNLTFLIPILLICNSLWAYQILANDSVQKSSNHSINSFFTIPPLDSEDICFTPNQPLDIITYQLFSNKTKNLLGRKSIERYNDSPNHQKFSQPYCPNIITSESSLLIVNQHSSHKFSDVIHLKKNEIIKVENYYLLQAVTSHLGFTLAIAFLQLFFFFYTRRKEHLFYTFFILSFSYTTLTFSGLDRVILPFDVSWSKYLLPVHYIGSAFLIWTSMHLLEIWKKRDWAHYLMLGLLLFSFSYGILSIFINFPSYLRLSVESFGGLTLILFLIGLRASFKKVNQAQLYTLAWAVYLVGLILFILNHNQIIDFENEFRVEILLACHSFEMLIFTLALSLKVYTQIQIKIKKIRELDKVKNQAICFPKQKLIKYLNIINDIENEYQLNSSNESFNLNSKSPIEKIQHTLNNLKICSDIFQHEHEQFKKTFFLSEIIEECRLAEKIPRNRFNFIDECSSTSFLAPKDIQIVVSELLKNANTHSPQGLIEIHCTNQHKEFKLSVHNQGGGFSKETLKRHPNLFF